MFRENGFLAVLVQGLERKKISNYLKLIIWPEWTCFLFSIFSSGAIFLVEWNRFISFGTGDARNIFYKIILKSIRPLERSGHYKPFLYF